LDVPHWDADTIFWVPTEPPFTTQRPRAERVALLRQHLPAAGNWVFSGSAVGWATSLEPFYDLIVYTYLDADLRMQRLRARERERFGDRLDSGGDMAETSNEFLRWAAAYDTAGPEQRSRQMHAAWLAEQRAPVMRLDTSACLNHLIESVLRRIDQPT
jgi:hypothetical protein